MVIFFWLSKYRHLPKDETHCCQVNALSLFFNFLLS